MFFLETGVLHLDIAETYFAATSSLSSLLK